MAWEYDKNHSRIGFSARHLGITTVYGEFREGDIQLNFEGEDPTKWTASATINAASIDTGIPRRDDALRGDGYLDTEKFPTIEFKSNRIEPKGDGYVVIASFTMHGVTKEIELDATFNGEAVDREVHKRGFAARGMIDRFAFGVGDPNGGTWTVGPEIQLVLDMETALK